MGVGDTGNDFDRGAIGKVSTAVLAKDMAAMRAQDPLPELTPFWIAL